MTDKDRLRALMKKSRRQALMHPLSAVPEQERRLMAQEKRATEIILWSPHVVPGVLQIPAYIREVAKSSVLVEAEDVELLVAARLTHQEILQSDRQFTFYVQEHALDLPVGGEGVMDEQLQDLLRSSEQSNISLRIVPMGVVGGFRLMRFPDTDPVVYVDSLIANIFLSDDHSVTTYEQVVESLERTSLSEDESRERISSRGSAS